MSAREGAGGPSRGTGGPRAIFLAGFMGSGKTTVGRALATRLSWPFVDLDDEIERAAAKGIPRIFAEEGEDGFRAWEHLALAEQARRSLAGAPAVLALGGGTYAFSRNRRVMRPVGPTVWLDAPAHVLWERVRHASHRPLARDRKAFARLHASRAASYSKSDYRVDAARAAPAVLRSVLGLRFVRRLAADG